MLYWECKRRLNSLREFRGLVADYFSNSQYEWMVGGRIENEKAQQARDEINRRMGDAQHSCYLGGVTCDVSHAAVGQVNLIANIFNLHQLRVPSRRVLDCIDRAIGNYERRERYLYRQMFNPFFWASWLLNKILSVPFEILRLAGFDAEKAEKSLTGRVIKAVYGLVLFAAALLAVLDYLGFLEVFKALVNSLAR